MTWRRAAEMARDWAARARKKGDERIALAFDDFAEACMKRSSVEDVTAVIAERKRGRDW